MKNREDFTSLLTELQKPDAQGWILLSESDLKLFDGIREIREIVLDLETPDYEISSRT